MSGAAWSGDGRSVVTWALDGTARVWDPETGATRVVLAGHGGAVTSAAFDPTGLRVLTTSADGRARVWSARVDADLRTVARVSSAATAASFSADGSFVAVAGLSDTQVLRSVDGDVVGRIPGRFRAVAVSHGGELAAVASGTRVSLRRVATAEETRVLDPGASVTAVAFSRDDRRLAVGTAAGTIVISTTEGRLVARFAGSRRAVTSVAFSPIGARFAAGFGDGEAGVWRLRDGRRLFRRSGHRDGTPVLGIQFDPAGRRIATAGQDGTVRVWQASRGRPSYLLSGHFAVVSGVSFSPNGHWLVSAGPGTVGLWDLPTRQRLLFLTGHTGRLLAAAFDGTSRKSRPWARTARFACTSAKSARERRAC